jgi:GNAT superfamily N-acetyltransferase
MQDIIIRRARAEDIPSLCDLLFDLFSIEADFQPDRGKQARGLELLVGDPSGKSVVLAAVSGREVVGMCSVQSLVSTAEGGPAGLVEDVVVRADHRRAGVGSRLLAQAVEWCGARGMERVQLLADTENRSALDFYASLYWKTTSLICLRKRL